MAKQLSGFQSLSSYQVSAQKHTAARSLAAILTEMLSSVLMPTNSILPLYLCARLVRWGMVARHGGHLQRQMGCPQIETEK